MTADYSVPVLPGAGGSDYERYMRTENLLSLQPGPDRWVHRDEMLFTVVHQATELWLRLACHEGWEAVRQLRAGQLEPAVRLLGRAALAIQLITADLEMLRQLAPKDFAVIRPALGHGSGGESPGWRGVRRVSRSLAHAWTQLLPGHGLDLVDLYRGDPTAPLYRLAEALIGWDERIAVWRMQHYLIASRTIGAGAVGTKGTPVNVLARLVEQRFFPELWQVRDALTAVHPVAAQNGGPSC
ncbi:tryptophan 2,3-dioxygenase family protein [Micromonospora sp. CPCC 206061]|uniref:tryptophan 2,3-dioxygenase family protein n=1 Tax=Micromonospora sp. CPCC 206061 TaxID=3122410 RepID=UPI002FF311AF